MTNVPDDAPRLLHKNPETTPEAIAEPFIGLYQRARSHFWREVLKLPTVDSVWDVAMRPKWGPAEHNPIGYDSRPGKLISRSWEDVRPSIQRIGPLIETDPSLLDVHAGLAHTFDIQEDRVGPEKVALFNLRLWTSRSLHWLWDHRLAGEMVALFGVQTGSMHLKGMAPKPMLNACLNASHDLSNKPAEYHADRQRHPASGN